MKFTSERRWWVRAAGARDPSLGGNWLPLMGLGGFLAILIFSTWLVPQGDDQSAAAAINNPTDFHQLPAIRVRLAADPAGHLAAISLNGQPVRDAAELRTRMKEFLGAGTDAIVEAQLDCDESLRYADLQRAVRTIASCPSADGRTMVPLVDRVKFVPRRGK